MLRFFIIGGTRKTKAILTWTLVSECPIPQDVENILTNGEKVIAAYKTFSDSVIFTTKRLIVRDSQNFTGKKVEIYSLLFIQL